MGLHALADGDDDNIRRDALFAALGLFRRRTALFVHLADDLRLRPQGDRVAARISLDAHGGLQRHELHALGHGALHLLGQSRHVLLAAAVNAAHLARAQSHRTTANVHRDVAAADNDDILVAEVRHVIVTDLTQHLDGGDDAVGVLALDTGLLIRVSADGDVERVMRLAQLVEGHIIADIDVQMHLDAEGDHGRDLRVEHLARQTIIGDTVAQHTAELRALFIYRDLVAHQRKIVRRGKAARPAADNGDRLACGLGTVGLLHVARIIHRVALQAADIDRVIDHIAAAARLARMLADVRAGRGERIVLSDEAHGVRIAAVLDEHKIARDIHTRGTQRNARHRLAHPAETAVAQDMLFIVVAEALHAVEHQTRRIASDGTVGAVDDHARHALDDRNGLHRSLALEHLLYQLRELTETDAAGHALAASLRMTEVQKALREVHRAQSRGARSDTPLHIAVQPVDNGLCMGGRHDIKS